jgi:hypothetical protein
MKPADQPMEQTTPIVYSDASDVMPVVPDWSSLDCAQIDTQIQSLQSTIMMTRFTPTVYNAYQKAISDGQAMKDSKCARVLTPSILQQHL